MLLGVAILLVLAIPVLQPPARPAGQRRSCRSPPRPARPTTCSRGLRAGHQRAAPDRGRLRRQPGAPRHKQLNQVDADSSSSRPAAGGRAGRPQQLEAAGRAARPRRSQQAEQAGRSSQPPTKQEKQADQQEAFLKTPASDPRLVKLENEIGKTKGVKDVSPATLDKRATRAVFTVIADHRARRPTPPRTSSARCAHGDPRRDQGDDLTAYVGGQTAGYIDLADRISDKLPLVIAIVVVLSFLLLLLAFRSILVPLTAGLMNLLSVGAAYGILTFVFQEGHGAKLIGLDGADPDRQLRAAADVRDPVRALDGLPGVPADQIQEHYRETSDNHEAVVDGLADSARVITSAALIMVCVFTSFILNGDPTVKQFGVGLAAAIAVDATIVRCLLVPAVMVLLGQARTGGCRGWARARLPTGRDRGRRVLQGARRRRARGRLAASRLAPD